MGIVRALKEFGNVVDTLPSPVTEIFYYFTVIIAVVTHSLAWPDRFFPFFFGVAEKGLDQFTGRSRLNTTPWHG